jgi:hypothetical protein
MAKKKQGAGEQDDRALLFEKRHDLYGKRSPLFALGGVVLVLGGVAVAAMSLLGYFEPSWLKQGAPWLLEWAPVRAESSLWDELCGALCMASALVLFGWMGWAFGMTKSEDDDARKARLKAHGSVVQAKLLGYSGGALRKNRDQSVKMTLEIPRPAGPVKVKAKREVPLMMITLLRPGIELPILLDPNDDADFLVLWDRLSGAHEGDQGEDDDA